MFGFIVEFHLRFSFPQDAQTPLEFDHKARHISERGFIYSCFIKYTRIFEIRDVLQMVFQTVIFKLIAIARVINKINVRADEHRRWFSLITLPPI